MSFDAFAAEAERVTACRAPFIVGVRHHSPACAVAMPRLLDALAPSRVLVELPAELEGWLAWLGHADLEPPVALAAMRTDNDDLFFYPFASFSPELVAVRWCVARGVPVEAFDLPFFEHAKAPREAREDDESEDEDSGLLAALFQSAGVDDVESLWDRLVEARGLGGDPESVRRAALLFGYALRQGRPAPLRDTTREAYMRGRLARAGAYDGANVAAVVGAFHASALVDREAGDRGEIPPTRSEVVTSLIPYAFELLDSRSGYPAGIRDPMWQERAKQAAEEGASGTLAAKVIVDVARGIRGAKQVAGVPDATEAVRLAEDLARLRGLPAPGRREVLEAITSALGQGEPLGRGRVLAHALEAVLVGRRRGRLAPGTPRSGLAPYVEALLAELKLPGPTRSTEKPVEIVLDPLRSALDRRRHVAIEQLSACNVPYGTKVDRSIFLDAETLTVRWSVHFTPSTEALLELAGVRGVTLEQAAAGALRVWAAKLDAEEALTAPARLECARRAAECGLAELTRAWLSELVKVFAAEAGLADLIAAIELLVRIARGHVPGLSGFALPDDVRVSDLLAAAVRSVEGLSGSERIEDARGLLELVRLVASDDGGNGRLSAAIDDLARSGSPLMQGAASAVRALTLAESPEDFGVRVGSWIDAASSRDLSALLAGRLRGALLAASPLFEAVPSLVAEVHARLSALDDDAFLARLPALREGFDTLSPAARGRLLAAIGDLLGDGDLDATTDDDPALLGRFARADRAGLEALARYGLDAPGDSTQAFGETRSTDGHALTSIPRAIPPRDRWRLVLGRERPRMGVTARRLDVALDELYGSGHGEGSRPLVSFEGGQDRAFPTVRAWGEELSALFGGEVREEVLGRAVERGSTAAVLELDPASVTPSVELLQHVLSLKGGLGEAQLGQLRPLVARVVAALVEQLATRIRPALAGLVSNRPSRRPAGPLDLRRTVGRNLKTARVHEGATLIVPDDLVFKARTRRSLNWHLVLVVDVSGSMEPSIIYSAMMGAILSALPALSVSFLAFNTEVIDLTERVDDPLGLLLEVRVGGGTSIAKAVRASRERLTVPARSMVVVVSDFEEGLPVPTLVAEVRALVETGARVLGLAALDDRGKPRYQRAVAELLVGAGMPIAALTPMELARWVGDQVR